MRINHNIAALNTYRQLGNANNAQQSSMEKLSSGLRINSAKDDAAGLAISEKMRAQVRGLDQASANAQDANSMIQTAEGALSETTDILQRMRELATQAANDTNTETDRGEIQKEINQLTSEINRIGNTTEFNTQKLLNGGEGQVGSGGGATSFQQVESSATPTTFNFGTNGADITIGDTTVTLDSDYTDIDGLVAELDGKFEGITVSKGTSGELVFSGADEFTIDVADNGGTGGAAALKITTGTDATSNIPTGLDLSSSSSGGGEGFSASFQIGANAGQSMTIDVRDMRATSDALKVASEDGTTVTSKSGKTASYTEATAVTNGTDNTGTFKALDVSSHDKASAAIDVINDAIESVSAERSKLGAYQNRLDHTINNLGTSSENLTAAESRIRDVDYALAA
jgi:flagellin